MGKKIIIEMFASIVRMFTKEPKINNLEQQPYHIVDTRYSYICLYLE